MRANVILSAVLPLVMLTGCGSVSAENSIQEQTSAVSVQDPMDADIEGKNTSSGADEASSGERYSQIDIDLTEMDSSMIYATVYDMVNNGDDYLGKTVKVTGPFSYFKDEQTGNEYFAVLVSDATACCSQGIEFVLDGDNTYPDDYPSLDKTITVVGEFNYYKEEYNTYCQLLHAEMTYDNSLSWEK
jgi:uncharacterized membrane protein YcgQ (UPF0703/DUF1980 family)